MGGEEKHAAKNDIAIVSLPGQEKEFMGNMDGVMLSLDEEPKVPFSIRIPKHMKDDWEKLNKAQRGMLNDALEKEMARTLNSLTFDADAYIHGKKSK